MKINWCEKRHCQVVRVFLRLVLTLQGGKKDCWKSIPGDVLMTLFGRVPSVCKVYKAEGKEEFTT